MELALGPMPPGLTETVRRWIEDKALDRPWNNVNEELNALFICGGPAGCCYLDATGEVWSQRLGPDGIDEPATPVEDGPIKVSLIAGAARSLPDLAAWLPRRPPEAVSCATLRGGGMLLPPFPRIQCPECSGLGWVVRAEPA